LPECFCSVSFRPWAKRAPRGTAAAKQPAVTAKGRPSALLDTRVIYGGDNLEQLAKLPDACVDLIYIDYMRPRCARLAYMLKRTCSFHWQCQWADRFLPKI
jgi:hypothetical protein